MTDDDEDEILLDWGLVKKASKARQPASGGRLGPDEAPPKRRRSPHGRPKKRAPAARPKTSFIPFPLGRRQDLVAGIAAQMIARQQVDGEACLIAELQRQAHMLEDKGVRRALIERELRSLASAVRAELWRQLLGSPSSGDPA